MTWKPYLILGSVTLLLASCAPICLATPDQADDKPAGVQPTGATADLSGPMVIPMKEIPIRGTTTATYPGGMAFLSGQIAACDEVPREAVKVYPDFVWKRPMHGRVRFGASLASDPSKIIQPDGVTEFQFALDASHPPEEVQGSNGRPVRQTLIFDRLYFDTNQDLDLTNDGVMELLGGKLPPGPVRPGAPRALVFEDLVLQCDFGPELGKRPIRLSPRSSTSTTYTIGHLINFLPKAARRGTFELGGRPYAVQIQQNDLIYGRFDRPGVYLDISPMAVGRGSTAIAWGPLGNWHQINGRFCTISATPMGDQLSIVPHQGDVGTIEFGGPDDIRVSECTLSSEMASLPVVRPRVGHSNPASLARSFKVPVGDYAVKSLTAMCGRLMIRCHPLPSDPAATGSQPNAYPVKIRKDRPYRFDFGEKRLVTMVNQTELKDYKPGDNVVVRAVLTLPSLGLSLYTNYVLLPKENDARQPTAGISPDLHSVVIRNARGDTVAQGNMRGDRYFWRIPKELELSSPSETFSATVTFQTHGLYGPVEATFPVVVRTK